MPQGSIKGSTASFQPHHIEIGRYIALSSIIISISLIVYMLAVSDSPDEDFKKLSDSDESENEITDDYQTSRSLGTDMHTHKISNFKYN